MKVQIPMVILVLAALIGRSIMAYSVQGSAAEVGEVIQTFNSRRGSTDLCQPLDPAAGSPISVSTVSELQNAVSSASTWDTILVADGTYNLDRARVSA